MHHHRTTNMVLHAFSMYLALYKVLAAYVALELSLKPSSCHLDPQQSYQAKTMYHDAFTCHYVQSCCSDRLALVYFAAKLLAL